jgi:hypothetical protein
MVKKNNTKDKVRQYVHVTDDARRELVKLINEQHYTIAQASKVT